MTINDPAKAKAFLRECLDGMDRHIAGLEARAQQEIQTYQIGTQKIPKLSAVTSAR